MTITPASPPELCPDCQRPKYNPWHDADEGDRCEAANGWGPLTQQNKCANLTITRLRTELAAAQALAPGGELAQAALDDVAYLRRDYAHESEEHQVMFDRIKLALRAKAGR